MPGLPDHPAACHLADGECAHMCSGLQRVDWVIRMAHSRNDAAIRAPVRLYQAKKPVRIHPDCVSWRRNRGGLTMGGCILRILSQSWTDTESSVGQQRWLGLIFGVVYYCGRW